MIWAMAIRRVVRGRRLLFVGKILKKEAEDAGGRTPERSHLQF